jgi:D-galacturonate reductase
MKILIIGGGMYVTGRGSDSKGTVMPAIVESFINGLVTDIAIVTTNFETASESSRIAEKTLIDSGIDKKVSFYPKSGKSRKSYLDALKDFNPDAVIISVPDHLHYEVAKDVLLSSSHCLIVKPFVLNSEHGIELIDLANKNNLVNRVEFHKRLDESNIFIRDNFRSGKFGKPLYFTVEYSQKKIIPIDIFKSWASESSIVNYLGVHYIDLIYYITDYKPVSVTVWSQSKYLIKNNIDTPDSMQFVIEWMSEDKDIFTSVMSINWVDPDSSSAMSDQRLLLVGTNARCLADQKNRGLEFTSDIDKGTTMINPYFTQSYKSGNVIRYNGYGVKNIISFIKEVDEFLDGNKNLNEYDSYELQASFKDALISTTVLEAISKASITPGNKIEVNL